MTPPDDHGGTVLIAFDGSDNARAAIEHAGRELRPGRSAIVVTVWQPVEAMAYAGFVAGIGDLDTEIEGQATKVAEEGAELARAAGFSEVEPLAERATPAWQRIVEVADERDVDLIVVGSRGRSALRSMLLGSVATGVALHTERPLLIIR
jgi:nucleotide-binding universal stress UspA family protein